MTEILIHGNSFWIGFVCGFVTLLFLLMIYAIVD